MSKESAHTRPGWNLADGLPPREPDPADAEIEHSIPGVRVVMGSVGRGLRATRPFGVADEIGEVTGKKILDPDHGSEYCVDMGDYSLEPGAPFRFLNHSCDPNAALVFYDDQPDELFVEAIQDIEPGEPITIDYAWAAECSIPCHCGSALCRGWIVSEDEAHLVPDDHPGPTPDSVSEIGSAGSETDPDRSPTTRQASPDPTM